MKNLIQNKFEVSEWSYEDLVMLSLEYFCNHNFVCASMCNSEWSKLKNNVSFPCCVKCNHGRFHIFEHGDSQFGEINVIHLIKLFEELGVLPVGLHSHERQTSYIFFYSLCRVKALCKYDFN